MTRPVILLDCDGVLANFTKPLLAAVNLVKGTMYTDEDIREWDMMKSLGLPPDQASFFYGIAKQEGFCASLEIYEGAQEGVEKLRAIADVYPVTSPTDSAFWIRERNAWLKGNFGFKPSQIIHAEAKHLVVGDILIDDKASTIETWQDLHPHRQAVLFARPWNKDCKFRWRAFNWKGLTALVEQLLA